MKQNPRGLQSFVLEQRDAGLGRYHIVGAGGGKRTAKEENVQSATQVPSSRTARSSQVSKNFGEGRGGGGFVQEAMMDGKVISTPAHIQPLHPHAKRGLDHAYIGRPWIRRHC